MVSEEHLVAHVVFKNASYNFRRRCVARRCVSSSVSLKVCSKETRACWHTQSPARASALWTGFLCRSMQWSCLAVRAHGLATETEETQRDNEQAIADLMMTIAYEYWVVKTQVPRASALGGVAAVHREDLPR